MRRGVFAAVLLSLAATLLVDGGAYAAAVTAVKPGDTGSLKIPLLVNAASLDSLKDAALTIDAPALFTRSGGDIGPVTISAGDRHDYAVPYSIGSGGTEGTFTVTVTPVASNDDETGSIVPFLAQANYKFPFIYDATAPQVRVFDGDDLVGTATDGVELRIQVADFSGADPKKYGSGPARLEILWTPIGGSQQSIGVSTLAFTGWHDYTSDDPGLETLAELPVGLITLRAEDAARNKTEITFHVVPDPPTVSAKDQTGRFDIEDQAGSNAGDPPTTTSGPGVIHFFTSSGTTFSNITATKHGQDITSLIAPWQTNSNFADVTLNTGSGIDDDDVYVITAVTNLGGVVTFSWHHVILYLKGVDTAEATTAYDGSGKFTTTLPLKIASGNDDASADPDPVISESGYAVTDPARTSKNVVIEDVYGVKVAASVGAGAGVTTAHGTGSFGGPTDSNGNGTYTTPIVNTGMLPGAVLFQGGFTDPLSGQTNSTSMCDGLVACGSSIEVSISGGGNDHSLCSNSVTCDGNGGNATTHLINAGQVTLHSSTFTVNIVYSNPQHPGDPNPLANANDGNGHFDLGIPIYGISLGGLIDPPLNRYDPGQSSATLTLGISLTGLNLSTSTSLTAALLAQPPVSGYSDLVQGRTYSILATPYFGGATTPSLNSPVTVTVHYSTAGLAASQSEANLKVLLFGTDGVATAVNPNAINLSSHTLSFPLAQFGRFKIVIPSFVNPVTINDGALNLVSDQLVSVGNPVNDPIHAQFLNVLASTGIYPVNARQWTITSSSPIFSPPARITVGYTTAELTASAVSSASIFLGQFDQRDATRLPLYSVQADTAVHQNFSGLLSQVFGDAVVAVYGRKAPSALRDLLAPSSTLSIKAATIHLDFQDNFYPGAPASGAAGAFYLVDQQFVSTTATPGQSYAGPFTVAAGTHTITYYSVDNAGNYEAAKSTTVLSVPPPTRTVGGLGLGIDSAALLWSVNAAGNGVVLAHNDANGVFTGSTTLSGADAAFPWSVFFDQAGNPYAVGSALGGNGADQVAVFLPTPAGDGIAASRMFDSGFSNNNLVFGAVAPGWIVGGVQTSGPVDGSQPGDRTYAMALWKVDTDQGLISLTTTYTRVGMDLGTGIAVDNQGNLWISGYSYSPSPRTNRVFDLSVWKYAPDGHTLLAGPFYREGYLSDFNTVDTARVYASSGTVYVATPRARSQGGTDTAFLSFDLVTGRLLTENAWRSDDGAPTFVSTLLQDATGQIVAAGSFDYGGTIGGIWRYGADGTLLSASQTQSGGAQGAVFSDRSIWLIVDGSTSPYLDTAESPAAGALADVLSPRTTVSVGFPSFINGTVFVTSTTPVALLSVDDKISVGDGAGVGTAQTYYAVDGGSLTLYAGAFHLGAEGAHALTYYGVDADGHFETVERTTAAVDLTAPTATLVATGSTTFVITAIDPVVNGAASGVARINYLVDVNPSACGNAVQSSTATPGTCSNLAYAGAFNLAPGTHTVFFQPIDNLGNGADVGGSSSVVVNGGNSGFTPFALNPSTGPIGVPFVITGSGFGSYGGANTRVLIGGATAPLSVWNDTTINGTIPGLATGTYAATIAIGTASYGAGNFTVLLPTATSISISSGPIGQPFSLGGAQFGPYAGTLTRVLIGGATAPLSVWNDNQIAGTVPNLPTGTYAVQIQRATGDGGLMTIAPFNFQVVGPSPTGLTPSSGPIGVPFTVTGSGFGPYAGSQTTLLFDGKAAPLSVWNDAQITGTVPNLSSGTHFVWIQRQSSDGGLITSASGQFLVTVPAISTIVPTSGPIGNGFTLTGTSFGPYAGSFTQALMGGATVALSVWNDTTISGTVPGSLLPGTYPLFIERLTADGGLVTSNTVYFQVTAPFGASLSVSSGPIGVPFTITGAGFGSYGGANTVVQVGGVSAPLSVWNDTTISGTIPKLSTGSYGVVVERISGANISSAAVGAFTVLPLSPTGFSPSSGSIGVPFAITGSAFGPYAGSLTRVLFDGTAAPLSVWNDTHINGTVPALSTGTHAVWIERASSDGGLESSDTAYFTVVVPSPNGFTPTSGPIGTPFTITGSGFGPYAGSNTRVLFGGVAASLSVWNDSQISGSVPGISSGSVPVWIERQAGTGVQSSDTAYFNITVPAVASLVPSSAPIGAPFTITGTSFGSYAGSNTKVLIGGVSAPLSVWNDTTISGTVPGALSTGTTGLVVSITAGASTVQTSTIAFTVLLPTIQTMSPASGAAGTGVQLTGFGFGPYAGSQTKVLLGTTSVSLSVWNDQRIVWTVPTGVPDGEYPVVVTRTPSGGTVTSSSMTFTVGSGSGGLSLAARTAPALAAQPDWHFEGGLFLSTETGGKIASPSHAAVTVPAGALSTATVVTMSRDRSTSVASRAAALSDAKLGAAGEAISFGPEGTHFAVPVTLELPYDPSLVPDGKLGELAIHYYDPVAKTWTPLSTTADPIRHVLTAQTNHFSLYQPLGHGVGVLAASAAFGLNAAYAFPNPVHSGAVTIRMQPGLADSVTVRIYDISGRKVHESSDFTVNPSFDDGNGLGPQYTYDHFWDISGVGSGVYTFALTAKKAGQTDIHKTGKIGVAK